MTDSQCIYGIDEAGRGPILGPMVVAIVGLDQRGKQQLAKLGVQDSKKFGSDQKARTRRKELAGQIIAHARVAKTHIVSVERIDQYTLKGQLNHLERLSALELLTSLSVDKHAQIVCDGKNLFSPLQRHFPGLIAINRGESAYLEVAAASILAKHVRDEQFAAIVAKYAPQFGQFSGGGYINAATTDFLNRYHAVYGEFPFEARKSWGAKKKSTVFSKSQV